jgi:hypothetical protein
MKSSSAETPDNPESVRIIITPEHMAVVDPAVPELEAILEYHARMFIPGGHSGYREIEERRALGGLDIRGRWMFPAGLLGRILQCLRAGGYDFTIDDRRKPILATDLDIDMLKTFDRGSRKLAKALVNHPLGRIMVHSDAQIIRFPDDKICLGHGHNRRSDRNLESHPQVRDR